MKAIPMLFKAVRKVAGMAAAPMFTPIAKVLLCLNGAEFGAGMRVRGLSKVVVTRRGSMSIGHSFRLNSGPNYNLIGRQQRSLFWVDGALQIGNGVGMSSVAIICTHHVRIGNNTLIGGNTVIYDSDFHSLDPVDRLDSLSDSRGAKRAAVSVGDNVFIGAHTTILKGVTIGDGSVIGAGSVVARSIPPGELWAGNPAAFVRKL